MSSFLRKRSASQCSFSNGDDEITVRKIDHTKVSRKSRSHTIDSARSSCSSVEASDFTIHDSCVIRHLPKHKSSHLRFLAWVAYTRKYADGFITEDERRTCPLLWCREVFDNQESMLQHVWNCPHLSKGLYWCFHCQKPERVGKFQCKRCQGAPSKTDRMASVAKKIFSKLGAKPHKVEQSTSSAPVESSKGLSRVIEDAESSVPPYFQDPFQQDRGLSWDHLDAQELPNTSVIPEMAGDWAAASYELPDTFISEMVGTECPIELGSGIETTWEDNFYTENLEDWDVPSLPVMKPRGTSPKLALDTSVAQNIPSSNWTETPLSATIISPMSAIQRFRTTKSPVEISPTDSEASGNSFFTDSGYSSATIHSATFSTGSFQRFPSVMEEKGKKREKEFGGVSEDWFNSITASVPPAVVLPVTVPSPITSSKEPGKLLHATSEYTDVVKPRLESAHWQDAPGIVKCFSEVLDSHIEHTKLALRDLPDTPINQELMSMSRASMVSIGLEVLAGIFEGRHPTAAAQIFAFTHIACAFAIAVNESETMIHTQTWFNDCLTWVKNINGDRQQRAYGMVARAVWEPLECPAPNRSTRPARRDKENCLLTACKHFLEIFESLVSPTTIPPANRRFNDSPLSFEHKAKTFVIDALTKSPSNQAFIENVINVESRLVHGQITDSRQLERELKCAGKLASQSGTTYTRFVEHVASLCDGLCSEEHNGVSRVGNYIRDINRIKMLMPDEGYGNGGRNQQSCLDDLENFDDGGDDLTLLDLDLEMNMWFDSQQNVAAFERDEDELLRVSQTSHASLHIHHHKTHHQSQLQKHHMLSQQPYPTFGRVIPPDITPHPLTPTFTPLAIPLNPSSTSASPSNTNSAPAQLSAPIYKCHCGYIPTGEEKWKASNLRRHKRTQHAAESKVYICRWKGCKSSFTRSDNLRCHVREKGHFEGAGRGWKDKSESEGWSRNSADGVGEGSRKKRRKAESQ